EENLHTIILRQLSLEKWNNQQVIERIERIEASPNWHLTIHLSSGNTTTIDYRTGEEVTA
ncbi:MAG: recombinase family protein, partial [Varibaculum sp.]